MMSTDIYLCKVKVNEYFKFIRKPYFSGFSEPLKVIEPNLTITQAKELAASKLRALQMNRQMMQLFIDANEKGREAPLCYAAIAYGLPKNCPQP